MSLLDKLLGALSQTCDFVFTWSMNFQAWGSTAVEEEKKKKKIDGSLKSLLALK